MLDVGWTELLVIAVVLIVVVGPKDLPPMLRAFGKMMTRLRAMAGDFRSQFDAALREADLDDVRKTVGDAQKLNPMNSLRDAINPLRQTANEIKADLQRAAAVSKPAETTAAVDAQTEIDGTDTVADLAEMLPVIADTPPAPVIAVQPSPVTSGAAAVSVAGAAGTPAVAAAVPPAAVAVEDKAARKPRARTAKLDDAGLPVAEKPKRAKTAATADGKAAAPKKTKKDTA